MKIDIIPVRSIRFSYVDRGINGYPNKIRKGRPIVSASKAAQEWAQLKARDFEYRKYALPNGDEHAWDYMTDADFHYMEQVEERLFRRALPVFQRMLDAR